MKKYVSFFIAVSLLFLPVFASAKTFEDVKEDHWAYEAVESLAAKGIIKGIPQNNKLYFKGGERMTRYEFAVALDRAITYLSERSGEPLILESEVIEVPTKLPTLDEKQPEPLIFELDDSKMSQLEKSIKNLSVQVDIHEKDILELGRRVQSLEEASTKGTTVAGKRDTTFWMAAGALFCSIAALLIAVGK